MNETFTCQVEVSIAHDSVCPPDYEYESRYLSATINYTVDIELRSWGIKNILFLMYNQSLELEVEVLHKDKEDSEYITLKLQLHDMETDLPENISRGDISPNGLDLTIESLELVSEGIYQGKATGVLSFESA